MCTKNMEVWAYTFMSCATLTNLLSKELDWDNIFLFLNFWTWRITNVHEDIFIQDKNDNDFKDDMQCSLPLYYRKRLYCPGYTPKKIAQAKISKASMMEQCSAISWLITLIKFRKNDKSEWDLKKKINNWSHLQEFKTFHTFLSIGSFWLTF